VPEDSGGEWRTLTSPDELVEYYDPTDVFGDLADALAEAFPGVAPEEETAAASAEPDEATTAGDDAADADGDEDDGADDSVNGTGGGLRG
jgi:hypothetical protein